MKYSCGEIVELGDSVLIENGTTPRVVDVIIEADEDVDEKNWCTFKVRTVWLTVLT